MKRTVLKKVTRSTPRRRPTLPKAPTGIQGLDELTGGGLPRGRPTLICGTAGCGKTLMAMEFLVRGAMEFGEPGVFFAFEENIPELVSNFASLGHDLRALVAQKKLVLEHIQIEKSDLEETGEYDLEGLFIRLGQAIDSIGAKRVVLDTIEALFSGFSNTAILRAELRRLFQWLKDKGVTAIITGERGTASLTRYGLEEYVADCVILLDHRVTDQLATRRLQIVKYRGSTHGTGENPFLIDAGGISIMPIGSIGLRHKASTERVSTGIARLDAMMGGKGYYRSSVVLASGGAGTGKTSLAAHFVRAASGRGERCLWFAFEESSSQITRNMRSIGIDLEPALRRGTLRFFAERPAIFGLEKHLFTMLTMVREFRPRVVIVDPISAFASLGSEAEIKAMVTRLIDFFKTQEVTALFTILTAAGADIVVGLWSLADTWIRLEDLAVGAEQTRLLRLVKSRGMAHSNQVREFLLTDRGAELQDVYEGPSGLLVAGSARLALEAQERALALVRKQETASKKREREHKRQAVEARIIALRAGLDVMETESATTIGEGELSAAVLVSDRTRMSRQRQSDPVTHARPKASARSGG